MRAEVERIMHEIQLFTEKEVSDLLRIGLQTLRNQRSKGIGLPYVKFGKSVRYCKADLEKFLNEHRIAQEMDFSNRN